MTGNKWRLLILVALVISVGIYYWASTTPSWTQYHKFYGDVASVEAFDALMTDVEADVAQNFGKYTIDSDQARQEIIFYIENLGEPILDDYGQYGYIEAFEIHAWAWVWDGAGMNPTWGVVGKWRDTWRECDYALPETKEAQFCMMGLTPAPRITQ